MILKRSMYVVARTEVFKFIPVSISFVRTAGGRTVRTSVRSIRVVVLDGRKSFIVQKPKLSLSTNTSQHTASATSVDE